MTFVASLASCLDALEHGESVESCLGAYPEYAPKLEPLLRIAAQLSAIAHSQGFRAELVQEYRAVLASSIEALERGEPVEPLLAAHRQQAERLEDLLRIAGGLRPSLPAQSLLANGSRYSAARPLTKTPTTQSEQP